MPKDSPDRPDFVFGPALFFRGATDARWDLRVLVVDRSPPPELAIDGTPTAWQPLWTLDGLTAFAADLRLPRGQRSAYAIGPHRWSVAVPARDGDLRIACVSCNGEESEQPHDWRDERDAAWRHLADAHRAAPFHLLFQLGDQLYADPVWGVRSGAAHLAPLGPPPPRPRPPSPRRCARGCAPSTSSATWRP